MEAAMDIIAERSQLFLGSRLKRLADRLLADAARTIEAAGLPIQPAHMSVMATIAAAPTTIGDLAATLAITQPAVTRSVTALVDLGLVAAARGEADARRKHLSLTPAGAAILARGQALVWSRTEAAVAELIGDTPLIAALDSLETCLDAEGLASRAARSRPGGLVIHEWRDDLAGDFAAINAEWISSMFTLEENDRAILGDPRGLIVDRGGTILFVEAEGLGIVGTGALIRISDGVFELTKMGVLASARGRGAGEYLLAELLARGVAMRLDELYLLTNRKCAAAVHLYEKLGFRHDAEIMATYGARYERCDVAMRFPL
ncbi:MarR family transcriptional regulator [alpha proteobacterium AAP81b]|nr:MarR family transcriptional regulator [alpha proteobacterium AAP81b]